MNLYRLALNVSAAMVLWAASSAQAALWEFLTKPGQRVLF